VAKKRKKKRRGGAGNDTGTWAVVSAALGGMLGNIISDSLEAGLAGAVDRVSSGKRDKSNRNGDDVAAKLLRVLADRGPMNIPDLMCAAEIGLTPLLNALGTSHQFKLVEFVGEGDMIKLTATGTRTATVVQQQQIKSDARRLLDK
jgi:hypothetical protein